MSNVIDFRSASERRVACVSTNPIDFPETSRQRASRGRNPYRTPSNRISYAVTIAGQLHRNEPMHPDINHIAVLRRGIEAALFLATDLARLLGQEG
jgi:hypothetical protein